MTSKVPKSRTKGCFQCSKRRIDCDLGQPQCKKCAKKDLECSGLGRIRFVQGVASRGKLKGSKIPTLPAVMVREDVEVDIEGNPCPCPAPYEKPIPRTAPTHNSNDGYDLLRQDEPKFFGIAANQDPGTSPFNPRISGGYVVTQQMQSCAQLSLQPWLPPIGHHARMLMSHFSTAVAPVMVVIDGNTNGYREFILPMACHDDLLQRTVGVVAAQHLSLSLPHLCAAAERGHQAILERLQRDATCGNTTFSMSTWVTLIVLLVGATIDPGLSFGPLLRMLLLTAQNCRASSMPHGLRDFLLQQTHMFELFARPQLDEKEGIEIISESLFSRLDWLPNNLSTGSEHRLAAEISRQAFVETFQLYLHRANGNAAQGVSSVKRLRALISRLDPEAHGAHALVWPCFVASIESVDMDDREFFHQRLKHIFGKTRFGNVQAAINSLPKIWELKNNHSWTANLANILPVLIM